MSVLGIGPGQGNYWHLYEEGDPFFLATTREDNFFEFDQLVHAHYAHKLGTIFLRIPGKIDQEKFLRIYNSLPDVLKHPYLMIQDSEGNTIIHHFAKWVENELILETFKHLSDILKFQCLSSQNNFGQTPLHVAAFNGNENTGLLMLRSIEDISLRERCISIKDNKGYTPLDLPMGNHSSIQSMQE